MITCYVVPRSVSFINTGYLQ